MVLKSILTGSAYALPVFHILDRGIENHRIESNGGNECISRKKEGYTAGGFSFLR